MKPVRSFCSIPVLEDHSVEEVAWTSKGSTHERQSQVMSIHVHSCAEEKTEEEAIAEWGGPLHLPSPKAIVPVSWASIMTEIDKEKEGPVHFVAVQSRLGHFVKVVFMMDNIKQYKTT